MSEVCSELVTIPRREQPKAGPRFYAGVARHLLDPVPYAVAQYRSRGLSPRGARRARADAATTASCAISSCPPSICRAACRARLCSSPTTSRPRSGGGMPRPRPVGFGRRLYRQQWTRMRRFEGRTMARFDRVLAVSDVDRDTLQRLYRGEPDGAGVGDSDGRRHHLLRHRAAGHPRTPPRIVFTGSMDWLPNVDGVMFFCRDILPLIRQSEPERRVHHRRPLAHGSGPAAGAGTRHRSDRPRRRCSALSGRVDGQRRAAAHRRRHATEDFRSDGRGPRRRLDNRRRGRIADRERPAPAARRRSGGVRALGRDAPARRGGAPGDGVRGARARHRPLRLVRGRLTLRTTLWRTRETSTAASVPSLPLDLTYTRETSMNISVFGLGYVGSVSAATFAEDGHNVIGVDVNPTKVDLLNAGQSPIVEPGLPELIAANVAAGRLRATTSAAEAIAASEVSLVSVSTPSRRNGSLDLTHLTRVCEQIGAALAAPRGVPRRRDPQHGPSRHDARDGHPHARADVGQAIRRRFRRVGQPGIPARGQRRQGHPAPAVDARRPQPRG